MSRASKRRWWKATAMALALALLVLMLVLAVAWWRLPDLLNAGARRWLPGLGLDEARVEVATARGDELSLNATAAGPGWRMEVDHLSARYTLSGLWKRRQADTLVIEGLSLNLDVPTLQREGLPFLPESEEPFDPYDFSWIASIPVKRIDVRAASVTVRANEFSGTVLWSGSLEATSPTAAAVELALIYEEARLSLSGDLRDGAKSRLHASGSLPDPLGLLAQSLPDWREHLNLPPDAAVALGDVFVEGNVEVPESGRSPARMTGELRLESVELGLEETRLSAKEIRVSLETDAAEQVGVVLSASRWEISNELFQIPDQPLELSGNTSDLVEWRIKAEPVKWVYGDAVASGSVALSAEVERETSSAAPHLNGVARFEEVRAGDFSLAPWELSATGGATGGTFAISSISLSGQSGNVLDAAVGAVRYEEANQALVANARITLSADAFRPWVEGLRHTGVEVDLTAARRGDALSASLDFAVGGEDAVLGLLGLVDLTGHFVVSLSAHADQGTLWSGDLSLSGENVSVHGDGWVGEGIGFEGAAELASLDPAELGELDLSGVIDRVSEALSLRLEWTANRLAAADFRAQWLSGGVTLTKKAIEGPAVFDLSASAGIVQAMQESLQQVEFSLRSAGSSAELGFDGGVNFWYGGSPGEVVFSHQLKDPLGSPALEGHYALHPLRFDYVDAAGRYAPSLEGLSFSGILTAEGDYWLREGQADASLLVRFAEGSVDYPASQVIAEGIEVTVAMHSLVNLEGVPGGSEVLVRRIEAGDLVATRARLQFAMVDAQTALLEYASVEFLDGVIRVDPATLVLDSPALASTIHFDRLSLRAITRQMSFFDGSMEGVISGYMPFSFVDGQLIPEEGRLQLPEGENAHLSYNSRGLFTGPDGEVPVPPDAGFMDRLTARALRTLGLQPERVVEDALNDLHISSLSVELFSADTPDTPIRIRFAGEAVTGDTHVPLNLETRVNGTLDELYNFLIRLNSLGPSSF